MILGKKKTVLDIPPKEAELSKGNGSDNNGGNAAKEDSDASIWGNKGNAFVESSMYAEAIKCYDKAIEINPKSMEAWNNRGLALARTGRLAEAVQCYDKALLLNPGDVEVMYNKGIALALLGKSAEAIECYDKLLAINPGDADAWCSRGDVLFESGRFEEALVNYDKSIAIDPEDETAWNNRGMTLVKLNRLVEAIESYDKALELNPRIEKIWSNKGLAIAKLGENNNNKIDLRKVAASLPKEDISAVAGNGPLNNQAEAPANKELENEVSTASTGNISTDTVCDTGKTDPCIPALTSDTGKAPVTEVPQPGQAEIKPDKSEPEVFIEKAESITNDKLADIENYLLSLPINKTAPAAKAASTGLEGVQAMAVESSQPGDKAKDAPAVDAQVQEPIGSLSDKNTSELPEQADMSSIGQELKPEPSIDKAVSVSIDKATNAGKCVVSVPVDAYITAPFIDKHMQGQAEIETGEQGPGIELTAERENPDERTGKSEEINKSKEYLVMGNTLYSLGKYEEAVDSYNKSLHIDPGNNTAWNNKGLALGRIGELDEAIDCYDRVLGLNPADHIVLNNKGSALYKKGDIEGALQCYRSALGLKPDSKTAKKGIKICTAYINKSRKTKGRV